MDGPIMMNPPLEWIKDLEWHENDERTDAELKFTLEGMEGSFLKDRFAIDSLNDRIMWQAIRKVALRFCDAITVEDFGWEVRYVEFPSGVDKAVDVWADIHLAYED